MTTFRDWAKAASMESHVHYKLHRACAEFVSRTHPKDPLYVSYPALDVLDYLKEKHDYWNVRGDVEMHVKGLFPDEYIDGIVTNIAKDTCLKAVAHSNPTAPEFSYLQKDELGNIVWPSNSVLNRL